MLADSVNEATFFEVVENFYDTGLECINNWKCNAGNTERFKCYQGMYLNGKKYRTAWMRNSSHSYRNSSYLSPRVHPYKINICEAVDTWNKDNISMSDR